MEPAVLLFFIARYILLWSCTVYNILSIDRDDATIVPNHLAASKDRPAPLLIAQPGQPRESQAQTATTFQRPNKMIGGVAAGVNGTFVTSNVCMHSHFCHIIAILNGSCFVIFRPLLLVLWFCNQRDVGRAERLEFLVPRASLSAVALAVKAGRFKVAPPFGSSCIVD